jgi:hypothetical protein
MHTVPERPIALLATAIPSAATLSVAIHLVHAIPDGARAKLAAELFDTAETNAADALHRCHRALELDGHVHGDTADAWLPVIYHAAAPLLESSRLDQEHRRSSGKPRRPYAGYQARSPASKRTRARPPQPSPTRSPASSSYACSPTPPA